MGVALLIAAQVLVMIRLYRGRYRDLDAWAIFLLALAIAFFEAKPL